MRRASRFAASLERQADRLLGTEYKLQAPPVEGTSRNQPRASRPACTAIDVTTGLAAALATLPDRASVVVVFAEGQPTAIVSRSELLRYFRARHADRLLDLLERAIAPDSIATLRISSSWGVDGATVGALRLARPSP